MVLPDREALEVDTKPLAEEEDASQEISSIDLEDVQKVLGPVGPYQLIQTGIHGLCYLPFSFLFLGFVFIAYEPGYQCQAVNESQLLGQYNISGDSTVTVKYGACNIHIISNHTGMEDIVATTECYNGYSYTGGKQVSMITEWDLVCNKSILVQFVQSALSLGMSIGMVAWTSLADRFSRKYIYIITLFGTMISELVFSFSQSVTTAIALRFFTGVFSGGMTLVRFVMGEETFTSDYRQKYGGADAMAWALCVTILSGCAYLLRNAPWRYLQLATIVWCLPALALSYFLDETPAWYFAKGKYDDAKRILIKACKLNGKNVVKIEHLFIQCVNKERQKKSQQDNSQNVQRPESNYSVLDIFRHKKLLLMTFVLSFCWFTCSFSYYGLYLTSSILAGNRYMNFFVLAIIDFPGFAIYVIMLSHMGRRTVLIIFFVIATCTLFVSTCLVLIGSESQHAANASTAFFVLSKLAVTVNFNIIFAFVPELFPTTMRSSVMGACDCFSGIGTVLSPFLLPLYKIVQWGPGVITSSSCAICVILLWFLPETRGRQLPVTIGNVLAWDRKSPKTQKVETSPSVAT